MKKIFILDAINFLFRSYYGIAPMTGLNGQSTNALFGFIRSLQKIISDFSPDYIVAVFDGPGNKKSRTAIYEEYKSNRTSMPEDLVPQLKEAVRFCNLAGIPSLMLEGVEADDTIGALINWSSSLGLTSYICTSDKDLAQLVSDKTFLVHAHKENKVIDKDGVFEIFGVRPDQVADYLSLVGDASDNIPGVDGIGPKGASTLLKEYDTLENVLENASSIKGKKGENLVNGKKSALLSKRLAVLDTTVEIPQKTDFYLKKEPDENSLSLFYQENRFLSFLKEKKQETPESKIEYTLISSEKELDNLLALLQSKNSICIDTETTALSPLEAMLVGVGLGFDEGKAWYVPVNGDLPKNIVLNFLKKLFEAKELSFYGHNIKYDLHVFLNEKLPLPKIDFDTMLASYLLTPHILKHNLDDLSLKHFSFVKTPIEELLGKGKSQITMDKVPIEKVSNYCCEDIDYTIRLKNIFHEKLKEFNLLTLLEEMEIPLISVLLTMERNGLFLDLPEIRKVSHDLSKKLSSLEILIHEMAEEKFNINSPKQLGLILFEKMGLKPPKKTKTGFSTSAETLESLQNESPIIKSVLEFRQLGKLRSTYADALQEQINPFTGRIHCTFNQSVAATGRLSCQSPNLQNIPVRSEEGKKIRSSFRPEKEDWRYLSADYSQIELRLLAHLSEDPILIKAFELGEDIHSYTASLIFNTDLKNVTKEMRYRAKAVNFGILYGQQAFGLAGELSVSYAEASEFIDTYFKRYQKVKEYIEYCKETARKTGFSTTITGRRRPIPEIDSKNPALRSFAERLAVNTPLQGTAADLIKLAMISIKNNWNLKESLLTLQIHDELLFEAPIQEISTLSAFAKKEMEQVFSLKVPLVVDISIGKNWGDC
jgi:DNA polymerase I